MHQWSYSASVRSKRLKAFLGLGLLGPIFSWLKCVSFSTGINECKSHFPQSCRLFIFDKWLFIILDIELIRWHWKLIRKVTQLMYVLTLLGQGCWRKIYTYSWIKPKVPLLHHLNLRNINVKFTGIRGL